MVCVSADGTGSRLNSKVNFILVAVIVGMLAVNPIYADEAEGTAEQEKNLYATYSYGATASWLTRIINQSERSNFVFRDFLPGLYFNAELRNVRHVTPVARLAVYYPLISTFNLVPQKANTPLHFGTDLCIGGRFETEWKSLKANAGPGLHLLFLSADRWNYLNLGLGVVGGLELALSPGWALLLDGFASIDNGNLGSNRIMEPFDVTYQYQMGIGVRYSRKTNSGAALPEINQMQANGLNR